MVKLINKNMETLIKIWLYLAYVVYWVVWLVSVLLFNVSCMAGIGIGSIAFIIHLVILQILYWINGDRWIWKP